MINVIESFAKINKNIKWSVFPSIILIIISFYFSKVIFSYLFLRNPYCEQRKFSFRLKSVLVMSR